MHSKRSSRVEFQVALLYFFRISLLSLIELHELLLVYEVSLEFLLGNIM